MSYRVAFPDFDPSTMPAIPADWRDTSEHNDAYPSFHSEAAGVRIWVDYADPADREIPGDRFGVVRQVDWAEGTHAGDLYTTDDWQDVLNHVALYAAFQTVGTRVKLRDRVEAWNLGNFDAGLTGTVTEVNREAMLGDGPLAYVKLDQPHPDLAEWDNVLQVFLPSDGDVTPDHFEVLASAG